MKEVLLTNCERNFVNKAVEEGTRLDGRNLLEARPVKIYFGSNWGSCIVLLGQTRGSFSADRTLVAKGLKCLKVLIVINVEQTSEQTPSTVARHLTYVTAGPHSAHNQLAPKDIIHTTLDFLHIEDDQDFQQFQAFKSSKLSIMFKVIRISTALNNFELLRSLDSNTHRYRYTTNTYSRVVAQVTCDIQQPKTSRPNEGMLHINVELNPLAAIHFDGGRQTEFSVLISRQLEKCFNDSKCIDLESLCIIADKKVWNLRVDINIINHDGNLIDCASIATLAALSHFHRPDVTSNGEDIIIHPFSEKDPLPLTLYHYPVCISFITFESGNTVMDPTYLEERVGVAQLTLGINSYRELCSLHFNYLTKTMTVQDVISAVSSYAANYAATLVQQIKEAVASDVEARYKKDNRQTNRFKECITIKKLTSLNSECISIKLRKWDKVEEMESIADQMEEENKYQIVKPGEGSAELITDAPVLFGEGGPNTWNMSESSEGESSDMEITAEVKREDKTVIDNIELSGDSEEETTEMLDTKHLM